MSLNCDKFWDAKLLLCICRRLHAIEMVCTTCSKLTLAYLTQHSGLGELPNWGALIQNWVNYKFKNIIVLDYWQEIPRLVFKALFAKLRPHFLDFADCWSLPDLADSKRIDTSGHDEPPLVLCVFFHWMHTLESHWIPWEWWKSLRGKGRTCPLFIFAFHSFHSEWLTNPGSWN